MAAPIGHQRRAIEGLIDRSNGAGCITWPLVIGPKDTFLEGRERLYLLGISERDIHTLPDYRHCVAVFGTVPPNGIWPSNHVGSHFCAMASKHPCAYAVKVRRATFEEARAAGVDERTAETVELLALGPPIGPTLRLVLTGGKATYARM